MIAIQASVIEANEQRLLAFTKILDAYEEPEVSETEDYQSHDEAYWNENASWTNDAAKALLNLVSPVFDKSEVHYVKNYIAIAVSGNNYFSFRKRTKNKSQLTIWVGEQFIGKAQSLLDEKGVNYTVYKNRTIRLITNGELLTNNDQLFKDLAVVVKEAWAG